jgi:hypothetical protein
MNVPARPRWSFFQAMIVCVLGVLAVSAAYCALLVWGKTIRSSFKESAFVLALSGACGIGACVGLYYSSYPKAASLRAACWAAIVALFFVPTIWPLASDGGGIIFLAPGILAAIGVVWIAILEMNPSMISILIPQILAFILFFLIFLTVLRKPETQRSLQKS